MKFIKVTDPWENDTFINLDQITSFVRRTKEEDPDELGVIGLNGTFMTLSEESTRVIENIVEDNLVVFRGAT